MSTDLRDICARSKHVDGTSHGWRFDGDNPYIKCDWCGEWRDARYGHIMTPGASRTFCQRHDWLGDGECPTCAETICEKCQQRPSTENWGGTHDQVSLARNPRLIQRWCRRCVVEAQLAHMRPTVAKIADLERELEALAASEGREP